MRYTTFVGIDIAAQDAHVALVTSDGVMEQPFIIEQSPEGMRDLEQTLLATQCAPSNILVVMEATGVYWMKLASYLYDCDFAVSVINPAQAHYFAKALLNRSKTDALDAQLLARLAAKLQPERWNPPTETYEQVYQRLTQRDSLVAMLQMERNRLHALLRRPSVVADVQRRFEQNIASFQEQIADLDRELHAALVVDEAWDQAACLLRSIKGFGPIVTAWLLTATHNFSACQTPEQIASYAGLVPRSFESGSSVHRPSAIGHAPHARLRQALYMASLSAVQHNPLIRAFYQRLLDNGKPKKVALCACARKLIHIAWAVVHNRQSFNPDFLPSSELLFA